MDLKKNLLHREFVNQGFKTESLFIALNKLAQDQSLHPQCNTLSYILFLSFEITCNTIYIYTNIYEHICFNTFNDSE